MPPPRRDDYDTIIRDLRARVELLERTQRLGVVFLPDSANAPPEPNFGGAVYVFGGALHYIGGSGTDTTVAPA